MKILKMSLMITLIGIISCSNEQNADVTSDKDVTALKQKTFQVYSLDDVLNGMRAWEQVRSNKDALFNFFNNKNSLSVNMSDFPLGNSLHAYACILDGELKFAIISEVYDHKSYQENLINYIKVVDLNFKNIDGLHDENHTNPTFSLPTQYILTTEALNRIDDWNANHKSFINSSLVMYQSFNIPTYSLATEAYDVYMGLKNDDLNPNIKVADLVLKSQSNLFFDTVVGQPPYVDRKKYYILDLL